MKIMEKTKIKSRFTSLIKLVNYEL